MSWWYPRFNTRGETASGNGDIWLNGGPLGIPTPGHSPQWYGDPEDRLALIAADDQTRIVDMRTGNVNANLGVACNARVGNTSGVSAGAGHWCGWSPSLGLMYDGRSIDEAAAPGAVDQKTGALYYLTPYQQDRKSVIIDGAVVRSNVIATEIVAGEDCATWGEYEPARTLYGWSPETGARKLSPLPATELTFVGIPVLTPTGLWLVTETHGGLIVHPWGGHDGYIIEGTFYYHHARFSSDAISIIATDARGQLVRVDQKLSDPRTDLRTYRPTTGTPDPIVVIGKDCWCAWFEFNQPPSILPPGNAIVAIRYPAESGTIRDIAGVQFAQFVQGDTVAAIEALAAAATFPPVVYWDSRNWPSWPSLPASAWLAIQAYCLKDETPAAFEADLRRIIESVPAAYQRIALVCQVYTSNLTLTTNLAGLVPVFARLARDYPRLTMLLPFSDQGRATGLQDHPEVRPPWQQLYGGITGTPVEEPPVANPDVPNYLAWIQKRAAEYPGYTDDNLTDEQRIDEAAKLTAICAYDIYVGYGDAPHDPRVTLYAKGNKYGYDENRLFFWFQQENVCCFAKIVIQTGASWASIGWNETETFFPGGGDRRLIPTPVPGVHTEQPPDPPSGEVIVEIIDYTKVVRRSERKGLTVWFDAQTTNGRPIVKADLDLPDDGEPSIPIMFLPEPRRDGRYVRGLAFKPVINGEFPFVVTAWDDAGNMGKSDGSHRVTVIP